jgi:hypothetical protein
MCELLNESAIYRQAQTCFSSVTLIEMRGRVLTNTYAQVRCKFFEAAADGYPRMTAHQRVLEKLL